MARKKDLAQVDQVVIAQGIPTGLRHEFGDYIEDMKASGGWDLSGGGNLSWTQLNQIAEAFKLEHKIP